jgi:hypothetical protein
MTEALEPRDIAFYGDEIIAVQQHDGAIYVLFSRMCENIGRPRVTETRRAQQHAVLSTGLTELTIRTRGGPQSLLCLRLDLIPLWLASIPSKRLKPAFKEKLVRYQTEAAAVLWEAFKPQILVEEPPANRESALAISQLEQIIEQSKAMQRMAEEQITLIRRMDAAARVVKALQADVAEVKGDVADVRIRLGELEERLHPSAYITDEQAAEVQSAVASVAMALSKHDPSKNHFQSIHAELHRRFKAKSYSLIRIEQYAAVLAFLEEWERTMEAGGENA